MLYTPRRRVRWGRSELDRLYIPYSPPHCEEWTSNLSLTGRSLNQATPSLGSYRGCGRRDSDTMTKSRELSHERETSTPHLGSRRRRVTQDLLGRNLRGSPPSGTMSFDPQQQRKMLWLVQVEPFRGGQPRPFHSTSTTAVKQFLSSSSLYPSGNVQAT